MRITRCPPPEIGREVSEAVKREATAVFDGLGAEAVFVGLRGFAGGGEGLAEGVVAVSGGFFAVGGGEEDDVAVAVVVEEEG